MIISASRRTDIPALHSEWFADKIRRGEVTVRNPYNRRERIVSLKRKDVDGFVFWSRNYEPFIECLKSIHAKGYRFYCHFTIIGYPRFIDRGSPAARKAVDTAKKLGDLFGPETVIWRYDPILLTSRTDPAWTLDNFGGIARLIRGATDTCVISFVDRYRKSERNLSIALAKGDALLSHPSEEGIVSLASLMDDEARNNDIVMKTCCESDVALKTSLPEVSCIDKERMERVSGTLPDDLERNRTRAGCNCYKSVDIGAYDTCVLGCAYCYANNSVASSAKRVKSIRPASEGLWL